MEKNNQKIILGVTIFVSAAAVASCLFLIIIPRAKKVYQTRDEFEGRKIEFEQIREDASRAKEYSDLTEAIRADQVTLEKAIIKKDSEVEFIQAIEAISEKSGNTIEISELAAAKKKKAPVVLNQDPKVLEEQKKQEELAKKTVRLKLAVSGNYRQFLDFLHKLENMPFVFQVDSIAVSKAAQKQAGNSEQEKDAGEINSEVVISFVPK